MSKVTRVENGIRTAAGTVLPFVKMKGKDYLPVMYRMVWFREEHPEASITTSVVENTPEYAIVRAEVSKVTDKGLVLLATAHKREDKVSFGDYLEKAETGSIGRALANCGYGTQFAPELEEGERIVDSPVQVSVQVSGPLLTSVESKTSTPPDNTAVPNTVKRGFRRVGSVAPVVATTTPTTNSDMELG